MKRQATINEDYVAGVMEQGYTYLEVMSELYNPRLKPVLLFPARLTIVTKERGEKRFSLVMTAKHS